MTPKAREVMKLLRRLGPTKGRAVERLLRVWGGGQEAHCVGVAHGMAGEAQLLMEANRRDYLLIVHRPGGRNPVVFSDRPFPPGIERLVPGGVTPGVASGVIVPGVVMLHLADGGQVTLSEGWAKAEGC